MAKQPLVALVHSQPPVALAVASVEAQLLVALAHSQLLALVVVLVEARLVASGKHRYYKF